MIAVTVKVGAGLKVMSLDATGVPIAQTLIVSSWRWILVYDGRIPLAAAQKPALRCWWSIYIRALYRTTEACRTRGHASCAANPLARQSPLTRG